MSLFLAKTLQGTSDSSRIPALASSHLETANASICVVVAEQSTTQNLSLNSHFLENPHDCIALSLKAKAKTQLGEN